MKQQTVIPIDVNDDVSLDCFYGAQNQLLVRELNYLLRGEREKQVIYLWGESGCGKTHLLNACCTSAKILGRANYYISLKQDNSRLKHLPVIDKEMLICVDDLDETPGLEAAQKILFWLYEELMTVGGGVIVSGKMPLVSMGLALKDLESRLSSGGSFNVAILSDEEKCLALKQRAEKRGFSLEDNVIEFIMSHTRRDTKSLFGLLDKLDSASLQAHRKITIPFVKPLL